MHDEDAQLIAETLNGSLPSFDLLMQRYEKLVFKIAYGFGKNKDNALDITQNTFLKTFENLHSFQSHSSFKGWLMRITYNEGINWTRKNKFTKIWDDLSEDMPMSDNAPTQEDELLAKENRALLLRSLFELNTRYRLAVVLRYFKNQPVREIAATLNCSEGVVKNMLFRSLQRLRSILQEANAGGKNEIM